MPPALQVKLLRVLETGKVRGVGGEKLVEFDVRVMAASNRNIEAEVRAGRFRKDLYYRLSVVSLTLPPLRERREDLADLIEHCSRRVCRRLGRPVPPLSPAGRQALAAHDWPGNLRELLNVLERAVLLGPTNEISPEYCLCFADPSAPRVRATASARESAGVDGWRGRPLLEARKEVADRFEREYLIDLLRTCRGKIGEAARRASVSPRSMSEMMKRHRLRRQEFWREPSEKP